MVDAVVDLAAVGWNDELAAAFAMTAEEDQVPGRVTTTHRTGYTVLSPHGEVRATLSGKLRKMRSEEETPVVGDWVVLEQAASGGCVVRGVLPRRTAFVRKAAGRETRPQVLVANVDTIFVVTGLDGDYNPRRIQRYLALAADSGAHPVVLLTKADLVDDPEEWREMTQAVTPGIDVHVVSVFRDLGIDAVRSYLVPGETVALLGSSGTGKSTLVNHLLGEPVQVTREVRESDSRGRHATTRRELFVLPGEACVIDTPGLREVHMWVGEGGLEAFFSEVDETAAQCRFSDCRHETEPGCAVRAAVEEGRLDPEMVASYLELKEEQSQVEERAEQARRQARRRRERQGSRDMRSFRRVEDG